MPDVIVPRDSMEMLGKVVLYDGQLARIVAVGEGRTIHLRFVEEPACPTCGHEPGAALLAHAPLFHDNVQPVPTLDFLS